MSNTTKLQTLAEAEGGGRSMNKRPCGECHLKPGEVCDICGAKQQSRILQAVIFAFAVLGIATIGTGIVTTCTPQQEVTQ